ncbi:ribosome silencing factor [Butyricicoccus sp.]|uniref:ribosome silencing factor n=1 Tax=Butyricicoccus sp. TaxID=2049021 RepID=UPI003D7E54DA
MPNTTRDYVKAMVNAMDSKRGEDIQVLKVADLTSIAEYFVICSATSTTQVKTLADEVEFKLKTDYDVMPHHVEGHDSASWILLDYGFALVHVFLESAREFYGLEKLWKDATAIPLEEL